MPTLCATKALPQINAVSAKRKLFVDLRFIYISLSQENCIFSACAAVYFLLHVYCAFPAIGRISPSLPVQASLFL